MRNPIGIVESRCNKGCFAWYEEGHYFELHRVTGTDKVYELRIESTYLLKYQYYEYIGTTTFDDMVEQVKELGATRGARLDSEEWE